MKHISLLIAGMLTAVLAGPALAQTAQPPASSGGSSAIPIIVVVGVVLLAIGLTVKLFDLRRKREAQAVQLQAQVSDALLREPQLFNLPITPTARVPFWSGSPATIEVAGQVPTPETKELVLGVVRSEAERLRADVHLEDRLTVVPTVVRAA